MRKIIIAIATTIINNDNVKKISNCAISFHSPSALNSFLSKKDELLVKRNPSPSFICLCTDIDHCEFEHEKYVGKCFKLETSNNSMNL